MQDLLGQFHGGADAARRPFGQGQAVGQPGLLSQAHHEWRGVAAQSYADDLVLMASTVEALQDFTVVRQTCAAGHGIVCTTTRTECVLVPPPHSRLEYQTSARLSGWEFPHIGG